MADIVDRLKKPRETYDCGNGTMIQAGECYGCYDKDRADAADEIERLQAAGEALIAAVERQLAMHGKGIEPSERVREAIDGFRGHQQTADKP